MLRHRPFGAIFLCSAGHCEDTEQIVLTETVSKQKTQHSSHQLSANNEQWGLQTQVRGSGHRLDIAFILIIARQFSSIALEMISGIIKTMGRERNNE